jgi:hypothetical protein
MLADHHTITERESQPPIRGKQGNCVFLSEASFGAPNCCNRRTDNLATFRVDHNIGGLTFTDHYTRIGNPSIIVFLDLTKTER